MPHYIISPRNGKRLEVAEHDLSDSMSWDAAMAICKNLDDGWRMPDLFELVDIFKFLHLEGFIRLNVELWYWSCSLNPKDMAYCINFSLKKVASFGDVKQCFVRCVRELPHDESTSNNLKEV
jgi:hypothetical protein